MLRVFVYRVSSLSLPANHLLTLTPLAVFCKAVGPGRHFRHLFGLDVCVLPSCVSRHLLRCRAYWCGEERVWNWFDVFLASTGVTDFVIQMEPWPNLGSAWGRLGLSTDRRGSEKWNAPGDSRINETTSDGWVLGGHSISHSLLSTGKSKPPSVW